MPNKSSPTSCIRLTFDPREASLILLARALDPAAFRWVRLKSLRVRDGIVAVTVSITVAKIRREGWEYGAGNKRALAELAGAHLRDAAFQVGKRNGLGYAAYAILDPISY
jgi:hypothetical protein